MESFSLLKYWKSSTTTTTTTTSKPPPTTSSTTTTTSDTPPDNDNDNDDGPFFDLHFSLPPSSPSSSDNEDDDNQQGNDNDVTNNLTYSPSDDLFFKIDDSNDATCTSSKSVQFPVPVSLSKSATKFRVFLHGLKRSKTDSNRKPQLNNGNNNNNNNNNKKFFTVKFKVEEVPIFSLLTRASSNSNSKPTSTTTTTVEGGEERNKKEVVQKYLKMVKPLYVKVSKKSESKKATEMSEKVVVEPKTGKVGGFNLKGIGKKHLGKSKSGVVHSMVQGSNSNGGNNGGNGGENTTSSKKRDDSLLQQQDGIQSAILHCKRSFNSSKDFLEGEEASSVLLTDLINEALNENKESTQENDVVSVVNEIEEGVAKG